MTTRWRPRVGDERGAAAVEFAIVVSLLLLLVFGIIAFGMFYSRFQVFQGAAREGARLAAVRASQDEIRQRVVDSAGPYGAEIPSSTIAVQIDDVTSTATEPCSDSTSGHKVTVTWDQPFDIVLPLVPSLTFTVTIRGVFRCE
ncbi:MAG TPA: TadE/TadG family type IV pilus assembly protein [Actinomycetota bacterium]|nr:TadE/TadG family type IV pilus assembly protein [Actinomycetota bacterium]